MNFSGLATTPKKNKRHIVYKGSIPPTGTLFVPNKEIGQSHSLINFET